MLRRLERSEAAWLAAIVLVSFAGLLLTLRRGFFHADDVTNLSLAHSQGLTFDVLTTDYFGHLLPGHRVLDWIVAETGGSWALALALMFVFWLLAVPTFYAVVRQVTGPGFLALATTAMFASSVVFVRTLEWPASGDTIVPAMAFTLLSMALALRWHETRRTGTLIAALVSAAASLFFYEKPVLIALYVAGILFVRAPSLRPRVLWEIIRRDLVLLGGLVAIAVVYVIVLRSFGYASSGGHVTLTQWQQFFRATWTRGSTPLLIGQTIPNPSTSFTEMMVWIAQAVLAVLVVVSIASRYSAWRAWALFAVAWAVNAGVIGYGRIAPFGVLVGLDPRYEAEFAFLIPLTLALAFARTEPGGGPVRGVAAMRAAADHICDVLRRQPVLHYGALAVLVGLWVASCANAYTRLTNAWPGHVSGVVTRRTLEDLDRITARGPATIVDGNVAFAVVAAGQARQSDWLHVFRPDVRFNGPAGPLYVIEELGAVRPARDVDPVFSQALRFPGGCLPAEQAFDLAPPKPLQAPGLLFQLDLVKDSPARVDVYVDREGKGFPGAPDRTGQIRRGDRRFRLDLGSGPVAKLHVAVHGAPLCANGAAILAYR